MSSPLARSTAASIAAASGAATLGAAGTLSHGAAGSFSHGALFEGWGVASPLVVDPSSPPAALYAACRYSVKTVSSVFAFNAEARRILARSDLSIAMFFPLLP